jgi:hypothetical protein
MPGLASGQTWQAGMPGSIPSLPMVQTMRPVAWHGWLYRFDLARFLGLAFVFGFGLAFDFDFAFALVLGVGFALDIAFAFVLGFPFALRAGFAFPFRVVAPKPEPTIMILPVSSGPYGEHGIPGGEVL